MTRTEYESAQKLAAKLIRNSGIKISEVEVSAIEIVDFGLGNLFEEGAQILTLVQTERISVKVLALFPNQVEPEHWHPRVNSDPGKEETIRVAMGTLYLYLEGINNMSKGRIIERKSSVYTCRNEIIMSMNDQITIQPGHKHWFMAGKEGAVIFSFSTVARDILDKFTDNNVMRITQISD